MHDGRRADGALTWVAVAVPGIFAGISWAATEGWPLWNRVLVGVAVALVIYAAIHYAIKNVKGNRR
jgi:phosphatidylglycerophosphate synthase